MKITVYWIDVLFMKSSFPLTCELSTAIGSVMYCGVRLSAQNMDQKRAWVDAAFQAACLQNDKLTQANRDLSLFKWNMSLGALFFPHTFVSLTSSPLNLSMPHFTLFLFKTMESDAANEDHGLFTWFVVYEDLIPLAVVSLDSK